jgi:hypothetical protein
VLTKAEIPTGPVKRQVAEAWNCQSNKRSRETPELEMKRQYKDSKSPETCQCCEHYGRLCLQEDSLMIAEARQCYHSDINRKLSTQDSVLERVAQDDDYTQTINLEDWSISFKEFQPKRSKQSKEQISKASQEKVELHNHWQIEVFSPIPTNYSLKWFNLHMTSLSRRILPHKPFYQMWR